MTETTRLESDEIRSVVLATVAAIAPETDLHLIRPDLPLRQQIELDSMDWLNLWSGLCDKLHVSIPECEHERLETLDSLIAYIGSSLAQHPAVALGATKGAPTELPRIHHAVDGAAVKVRPIRADDSLLEAEFVRRLSDDSRYARFMGTLRELPASKLKYLTDVDNVHHVALVATVEREGREALLGAARYVVDPSGQGCEFAVAVEDAWQGSGVAGILMKALIDVARARGLIRMEGIVLATNRKMLKFARQLGFSLQRELDDRHTVRLVRML
jgi:GNAT superfamily N-acetyltransferase/acyl carrier protein